MSEAVLKNDPGPLVDAVRQRIISKIDSINSDAENEIKRIEGEVLEEIKKFRDEEQSRFDEKTAYGESKAANLLSIELKKMKLDVIDDFISSILSEVSETVITDSRYGDFLVECVLSSLPEITGKSATVRISPRDSLFTEMIMKSVNDVACNLKIRIIQDETIAAGGAIVIDDEPEIVFNNTVERILHRKGEEIRRIIARSVKELTDGERGPGE